MKLDIKTMQGIIVALWLATSAYCLVVAFLYWQDVPANRGIFLKEAFESFAPGLGVMLAAFFSKRPFARSTAPQTSYGRATVVEYVALIIAILYVSVFILPVTEFVLGKFTLKTVNDIFPAARLYTNWLVLPMLAYYFGSSPSRRASGNARKIELLPKKGDD